MCVAFFVSATEKLGQLVVLVTTPVDSAHTSVCRLISTVCVLTHSDIYLYSVV